MEWFTLIASFLQPLLLKCFEKTSAEDPQQVLREAYDPVTGKMDPEIVNDAIPNTRRAAAKARRSAPRSQRKNFPRLSKAELYDYAERTLIDAMNATPEKVQAVRGVAASMTDDDDLPE